jgi:hypothetical protein
MGKGGVLCDRAFIRIITRFQGFYQGGTVRLHLTTLSNIVGGANIMNVTKLV